MTGFPCIKPTAFMSFILQFWVRNLLSVGERTPCLPHQLGFHSLLWEAWSAPKPTSFWDHLWVYKTRVLWVGLTITKLSGFVYEKIGRSNQRAEQHCRSALRQHRCEQQVEDVRRGRRCFPGAALWALQNTLGAVLLPTPSHLTTEPLCEFTSRG